MAETMNSTRISRFLHTNSAEFGQVYHRPISDYRNTPLMSLEEAVQAIVPFIPNINIYADRAKKFCKKDPKLTINESAAVYLYTMDSPFYPTLNQVLRNENPQALQPWYGFLKLFTAALSKLPSRPTTVWRGVAAGIDGFSFVENMMFTWFSVNSCSSKINVAQFFGAEKGVLFCINTIYGRNITAYSANTSEEEVILMPGTCLRVESKSLDINGLLIIHLNEW